MDIQASIIDQRVRKIATESLKDLEHYCETKLDESRARSAAFTLLCVQHVLDIPIDEALECLTDGPRDGGVDALHIGDVQDGEFPVSLFQAKYDNSLEGQKHFEETAIIKMIQVVGALFDPKKEVALNNRLMEQVAEIRSLIGDGYLPAVKVFLCNNGLTWNADAQAKIAATNWPQVEWIHINHGTLVDYMQLRAAKPPNASISLVGKAVVEEFNYRRVLIGKVPVQNIADLFEAHGEKLLERNIRRYLGLYKNRVNEGIRDTLTNPKERGNFYFYNNGITMICSKFRHNALQQENYMVQAEGVQVINGGQTCMTIRETLKQNPGTYHDAYVLLRLYELGGADDDLTLAITTATNSQNPVDLRDLRANDKIQKELQQAIADLGYDYRPKRDDSRATPNSIAATVAAEAVLAVWRHRPHVAKFKRTEIFGKLYDDIFRNDLNGAQLVIATLIFRFADNERRSLSRQGDAPRFLPYATYFVAMVLGDLLLSAMEIKSHTVIDHRNFNSVLQYFEEHRHALYSEALDTIGSALEKLGLSDSQTTSSQRLSSAFRRGDLLLYIDLLDLL